MLFNSAQFLIFFPVVTLVYFAIPKKIRNYWLLIISYYFYMCWNPKYILLLMASTLITYTSGLLMENIKGKKYDAIKERKLKNWVVAGSFILNVGMLFYYKYTNFAIDTLDRIFAKLHVAVTIPTVDIVLPVGISFFVFQSLSYTMDVYRDEIYAEKNFFRYALFVSFFPQLVAGPIERSKNLLKQLSTPGEFEYERVRSGLLTMLWGFFLKLVIADRAAVLVNVVYNNVYGYFGYQLVLASVLFALQIYCDFMSYSIIAKGSARVLGYNLMDNFDCPYFATSIKDFWRRWHISLSSWLRDYLYIPLGGNRKGRVRKYINIMITFFVSGLWHGAAFTYIAWGLIHGMYQIIGEILMPVRNKVRTTLHISEDSKVLYILKIIVTFVLADIAWVFFRANSITEAFVVLKNSFYLKNLATLKVDIWALGLDMRNAFMLVGATAVLVISSIIKTKNNVLVEWVSNKHFVVRYVLYWGCLLFIIFSMDIGGQEFIYFQF
ncbi:MBOAT family O-acyltransferase [Pseudobutyrivibrio ruminis]|uniref:MBOAT family O-acyltransferase n=1 Tax=Pseudobutyrivibrio ruminis TaxID=46206 RepID=UPI000423C43C|nr:MBOAT family O-acyltransferase [Pseudobutyrivibrio ruminis]